MVMWWLLRPDVKGLPQQPLYPIIPINEIPAGAVLLHYNGNWMTEKCGRVKEGFPCHFPPFHASLMVLGGKHLNQGKTAKIDPLEGELRSTRRIDTIIYHDMNGAQNAAILMEAEAREGMPYDCAGFLWAGGVKLIRPWVFADFCSEQCAAVHYAAEHPISARHSKWTTPTELWKFGKANPSFCEFRTVWVGLNYPG